MNANYFHRVRRLGGVLGLSVFLLASGCLEKRLVWAPDGSRAAVIGSDGLYLCDAEGNLSGLLASDIKLAAWMPDSHRLIVTRERETGDWSVIAPALGDMLQPIEAQADEMAQSVERGKPWSVVTLNLNDDRKKIATLCARARHGPMLQSKLSPSEWSELASTKVKVTEMLLARIDGQQLALGAVLYAHCLAIEEVRPCRNAERVAWTQSSLVQKDDAELMVANLEERLRPTRVARRVSGYPDWDASGQALIYVEAAPAGDRAEDEVVLGVLTERKVVNDAGAIALSQERQYLAGVLFNALTHVRCLRDGRILFNATEMALPVAAADYGGDQREQLFAIDPARQSTLVRLIPRKHELELPQALAFFEVSPDESQVVFGGLKNEVAVLTLATGDVTLIQDSSRTTFAGVPVWRAPGEITYVKRTDARHPKSAARPAEIILRRGDKETVLSRAWPDEVLAKIATETKS